MSSSTKPLPDFVLRIICYGWFVLIILINYYISHDWYSEPENLLLENVPLDCDPIVNNKTEARKYKKWYFSSNHVENELGGGDFCETVNKYFLFEKTALSDEEKNFPLAYGLIVYHDIVQVLLQVSVFYQPQNQFCFTVDEFATDGFKKMMMKLPSCFKNMIGQNSAWGSFGIVENMYNCVDYLATSNKEWKYFQVFTKFVRNNFFWYLSGSDIPIRTNLEMVRVMQALNGSINTDVELIESNRLNHLRTIDPPLHLYKGSMSVALPRTAANYIVRSKKARTLLDFLSRTIIPDESVWTSLGGNKDELTVPGSFNAKDIMYLRHHKKLKAVDIHTVDHVGSSFIARYQVWWTQPGCKGKMKSASCVFGVGDVPIILKRPELIAHKIYRTYQPAALMCLIKELRRRSYDPINFDATSYSEMPTVELHNGKSVDEITHPDWVRMSSFT